jgi:flagellar biosynthesis protein FlhA
MGLSFQDAAHSYTLLTIGDGLVSQIPALIVSTAAGLLVSKAGLTGSAEKAMFGQLSGYPQALGLSSVLMLIMSVLPGIPMLPFLALGGGAGALAWRVVRRRDTVSKDIARQEEEARSAPPPEEPIQASLALDSLRLELGYGLLPLINDAAGHRLTDQIKALRRQLAGDLGFVMPSVRILDNLQLGSNAYVLRIKEVEVGRGELRLGQLLAIDPRGEPVNLPGAQTTEPAFGLPATWIDESLREEASFRGYTVVEPATVITTHLTEVVKANMADMLSYAEVQKLLDDLGPEHQKLVSDLVPSQVSIGLIQRVLQTMLGERVSIRDLPAILEAVGEAVRFTQNPVMISEHVRSRLGRQICNANIGPKGYLPLLPLSPQWEQAFAEALVGHGEERQLSMAPSRLQDFINNVRIRFEQAGQAGEVPVLLTSPGIRPYVRSIVERFRPQTVIMSQNEIHPQVKIRTVGQIDGI